MKALLVISMLIAFSWTFSPLKYKEFLKQDVPFTVCDPSVDGKVLQVTKIDAENVAPGKTATVTVTSTALADVTVAIIKIHFPNLPLPLPDIQVHKSAKKGETLTVAMDHSVPSFIPHGTYHLTSTSFDDDGNHVDCVEYDFTI